MVMAIIMKVSGKPKEQGRNSIGVSNSVQRLDICRHKED